MTRHFKNILCGTLLAFLLLLSTGCNTQRAFETPNAALDSLVSALKTQDHKQLRDILGPDGEKLLTSGDPVADANSREAFLDAFDKKHQLIPEENGDMTLTIGDNDWPLPIPLVKNEGKKGWIWDVAAGKEEVISRRVGQNELNTIQTCLAIFDAQNDYAQMDPERHGIPVYAQKFISDPGRKNGLFWRAASGEPDSPLGLLAAAAQDQGYFLVRTIKPQPFQGYIFRMLFVQGPSAPGGAREYIVDGKMLWGFAVVAYPIEYGKSGVKTFMISQDGIVFEKDLGDLTEFTASNMKSFNPGSDWYDVASAKDPPSTQPAP